MKNAIAELTEKEKQTLRLIVLGHDAKSMANALDLSVHTINERLRSARRKLETTSSREAARTLFESEGGTYETLVDNDLGDEADGRDLDKDGVPAASRRVTGPVALILAGVALMLAILATLALSSHPVPSVAEAPIDAVAEEIESNAEATRAAFDWLNMIDDRDWQASYDATGKTFREANTLAGWSAAATGAHGSFGKQISREVTSARFVNAPPHGFMEVVFQSQFANRPDVKETVVLEHEDGIWKPVSVVLD